MGKEWLYKTGGGGGGKSKKGGSAGKSRNVTSSSSSSTSWGCMSAILQIFDIQHHHHQFRFQQSSFISDHSNIHDVIEESNINVLKGVEAPRNSLELEAATMEVASSSSLSSKIKEANLNIPMGGIQIKTKRSRAMDDLSSECSSSPGTKTPNLVARLMGLDLLPENSSPRPSSSSTHSTPLNPLSKLSSHHHSRSLPATPRVSTASRRSTDIDYHHRLSLQINKENCQEEMSTSQYAKQIAKQVRENISRRVGADITNTMGRKMEQRRDENLVLLKPKRTSPSPFPAGKQDDSCSPRLRLLEFKKNVNKPKNSNSSSPLSTSSSKPRTVPSQQQELQTVKKEVQVLKQEKAVIGLEKVKKCKRIANERYDLRLKKMMHQQEEPFVKKKCKEKKKSTPLSNVNTTTTTKFLSIKKDMMMISPSSSTAPTLPEKQVSLGSVTQLPSCQSRSYDAKASHTLSVQDNVSCNRPTNNYSNGVIPTLTTGGSVPDHSDYITTILNHSGIDKNTPISIAHWYSPSHPLNPSIFQKLSHPTTSISAADQKLIFEVVDELLVEILKPILNFKPWVQTGVGNSVRQDSCRMRGSELVGKLCRRIKSFPAADCRVLEDIDGLIEGDMGRRTRGLGKTAYEEEAEELVREIEGDVVEMLVDEMIWQR